MLHSHWLMKKMVEITSYPKLDWAISIGQPMTREMIWKILNISNPESRLSDIDPGWSRDHGHVCLFGQVFMWPCNNLK